MDIYRVKLNNSTSNEDPLIENYERLNITNEYGVSQMSRYFAGNLSTYFIESNLYNDGYFRQYSTYYIDIDFDFKNPLDYIKNQIIKENRNAKLKMLHI